MRPQELEILNRPYEPHDSIHFHQRFDSTIGADLPSNANLASAILNDLDPANLGVRWWGNLPPVERILIGDYLYQSTVGVEVNLSEAQLHFFEWLQARDQANNGIADSVVFDEKGVPHFKHPPSNSAADDLPNRLERLHLGGFFRAIGSSLDCLGAAVIGVLGLRTSLRYSDLKTAEKALVNIKPSDDAGRKAQLSFLEYFFKIKRAAGPEDWLEWTNQYRNMFVHRGRRASYHQIIPKEHLFYDARGQLIPRATSTLHLARYPDRSEIEGLVKGRDILLNEDAENTLKGIFKSCRQLEEQTCERLCAVWNERQNSPNLIDQPIEQWRTKIKATGFPGYQPANEPFTADELTLNESLARRMRSAAVDDAHRAFWDGSEWAE